MKSALKISIKKEPMAMAKKEMKMMDDSTEESAPEEGTADDADKEFEQYELEDACHTLQKAMEIKHNPALMAAIAPMLDKKKKAINSIDDLRKVAKDKAGSDRIEG